MLQPVGFRGSARGRVSGRRAPSWATCGRLPFGFEGLLVRSIQWGDVPCNAVVRPDWDEINRRADFGLGAVTDLELLKALQTLPCGVWVGWETIDPIMTEVLTRAPAGAAWVGTHLGACRLLRPPLEVIGIYAVSEYPLNLYHVAWMAPCAPPSRSSPADGVRWRKAYAPTGLVLVGPQPHLVETTTRAERYGLGLALREHGRFQMLCSPVPPTRVADNHAQFVEVVYDHWLHPRDPRETMWTTQWTAPPNLSAWDIDPDVH